MRKFIICVATTVLGSAGAHLLHAAEPPVADPHPAVAISVELHDFRNDTGQAGCSLYAQEDGFPSDPKKADQETWCQISKQLATCTFSQVAIGTYAIACFHDEDGDGALKMGTFGPKEGTVVSNNAKGFMGPPKFKNAKFEHSVQSEILRLNMAY
jgi:uncharacterized protein (DUF2141 family)